MYSRPIRMHRVLIALLLTIATGIYASPAFAQTPQNRIQIAPGAPISASRLPEVKAQSPVILPPGLTPEETETFKKDFAEYQECRREKADEIRLTETANNIISFRDRRDFWEAELARNASLRTNIGSYDQGLSTMFAMYRSLGGTASTIDAVVPIKSPCTNPWETLKRPKVPLTDRKRITIPAK